MDAYFTWNRYTDLVMHSCWKNRFRTLHYILLYSIYRCVRNHIYTIMNHNPRILEEWKEGTFELFFFFFGFLKMFQISNIMLRFAEILKIFFLRNFCYGLLKIFRLYSNLNQTKFANRLERGKVRFLPRRDSSTGVKIHSNTWPKVFRSLRFIHALLNPNYHPLSTRDYLSTEIYEMRPPSSSIQPNWRGEI